MVKLRMTRMGKKKRPFYRIIAIDSRKRRDGDYIEKIGLYDPVADGQAKRLQIDPEKAIKWLLLGAQPSPTVKNLFSEEGIMLRYDMMRRIKRKKVEKEGRNGKKIAKFIAVTDDNGEPVRKYSDEEVEEAYKNWLLMKEKRANKKTEKKTLSKKAKAKIEAEKKAADEAKKKAEEEKKATKETENADKEKKDESDAEQKSAE
ncbi:MAG: 30S ribosomal protein S16 [Candidatus Delongbacteria bacterium]